MGAPNLIISLLSLLVTFDSQLGNLVAPQIFSPVQGALLNSSTNGSEVSMHSAPNSYMNLAMPQSVEALIKAVAAGPTIAFEVCSALPEWVRPSESRQLELLRSLPRYGDALDREPLRSLMAQFWSQNVITFTRYGLSLRMEPLYFSGLWTQQEAVFACYNPARIEAINAGKLGELWVLLHQVEEIRWLGNRYQVIVQPTDRGAQVVQFNRREQLDTLPVEVITRQGKSVKVISGDLR